MSAVLNPILAFLLVAACYGLAGFALLLAALAVRTRRPSLVLGCSVAIALPVGGLLGASRGGLALTTLTALICLVVMAGIYRFVVFPGLDWQIQKLANETRRQTVLHLVLLTGSVVFLVPFAWLVST